MADLSTTRNYADGEVLVRADLDAFLDDIETFLNVTQINDDNIQNSGITGSTKLLNQSVTEGKLAANSVTTLKIAAGAVTTTNLADDSVTTSKIVDSNVTTAKILDANITIAKMAAASVGTSNLVANSATSAIVASDASIDGNRAITTNHIQNSAVTTAKINAAAVTRDKLSANYFTETHSFTLGTSSPQTGTFTTGLTTTGRMLRISILGGTVAWTLGSGGSNLSITMDGVATGNKVWTFNFADGATPQNWHYGDAQAGGPDTTSITINSGSRPYTVIAASAAAHTFGIRIESSSPPAGATITNLQILVEEI